MLEQTVFSAMVLVDVLERVADTNKLGDNLLHVGDEVLACHQIKGLLETPMFAKNTGVTLTEGEPHFAALHNHAVMVPDASIMVRVGIQEVTRGIEMFRASAGVKLVRLFPVFGGGSKHRETDGVEHTSREKLPRPCL